ncbi:MAG: TlpA family protein disulfide reductase [Candidatus Zixiibacteriota bacterium]
MNKLNIMLIILIAGLIFAASENTEEKFPDFKLDDIYGESVSLSDMVGERPIIVTFWATWCKPCKKELEKMKPIFAEMKDKVHFIAINQDGPRSRSKVSPYVKSENFEYTFLYDDNKDVMMRAGVSDIPELFILDLEGNIVYRHRGYKLGNEIKHKKALDELLETIPCEKETSESNEEE